MVRLNQSYTADNSTFQVFGELGANRTRIGFDAAICVEEVRGYVVDAYNNVGDRIKKVYWIANLSEIPRIRVLDPPYR